jgi:hypothetical protein
MGMPFNLRVSDVALADPLFWSHGNIKWFEYGVSGNGEVTQVGYKTADDIAAIFTGYDPTQHWAYGFFATSDVHPNVMVNANIKESLVNNASSDSATANVSAAEWISVIIEMLNRSKDKDDEAGQDMLRTPVEYGMTHNLGPTFREDGSASYLCNPARSVLVNSYMLNYAQGHSMDASVPFADTVNLPRPFGDECETQIFDPAVEAVDRIAHTIEFSIQDIDILLKG